MTDRRFNEDEVAAILRQATELQQMPDRQLPSGEGMTLAELQDIGRQVGIAPEVVAKAATSLDRVGRATSRRFLGLTIGVGRTVDLGRKLSDDEWERLVVDLRETFDARGRVKEEGAFRQWTNGMLQVLVEPTVSGHRVRLSTLKSEARTLMTTGALMFGAAVAMEIAALLGASVSTGSAVQLAASGAALFVFPAIRLPRWSQTRRAQMEEVAGRLTMGQTAGDTR